ncbi:hypothetical protein SG34_010450 [Thalassomonas viridans]|uniref:Uncharacterized protein n=1 Tax=Thalassomonas viridans TaxID=137584 RepID=A0AAE9Z5S9_9GAMM|nr:hypothetical protein [Thalassomonas viridans]WDE07266.1 hypothetical protein SG34_010450 [Thalassomonas viridans]
MKIRHTKVTDPSKKQELAHALANLIPDHSMKMCDWVRQKAKELGVTPNTIYRNLAVKP